MTTQWRLARSIEVLRKQVNDAFPDRRKSSDGTIGDTSHSQRHSDHNPNDAGVVCAIDITHDPANGVDARKLAQAIIDSKDPRIQYVISNRQICSGIRGPQPGVWRQYNGTNPHNKHMHLSVSQQSSLYDKLDTWKIVFPKAVKKGIVSSKIVKTGGAIAGIETADAVNTAIEVVNKVGDARDAATHAGIMDHVQTLLTNPRFLIAVAIVVAVGFMIYWRWRDHQ